MVNLTSEKLNVVFSALSDPTRREMLLRLSNKQMSVSELSEPFAMSKPAVTKHLKYLERAGLIRRHIDGRVHRCELVSEPLSDVAKWIGFYEKFWTQKFDQLEVHLASLNSKKG